MKRLQLAREALNRNTFSTVAEVAHKIGVTPPCAVYYLKLLEAKGEAVSDKETVHHVDSKAFSTRLLFRLRDTQDVPPEAPVPPTPAAYRNLRLTENLTGYESTLHGFAALCMTIRK